MATTHLGGPLRIGASTGKGNAKGLLGIPTTPILAYKITPTTIVTTAVAAAQAVGAAGNLTLDGTLVSNGVVTFDVPRVASIVSSTTDTTQTATFYGTDTYGVALTSQVTLNGATPAYTTKAFKTITRVAISALCAGNISSGNGDVFGLPYYCADKGALVSTSFGGLQIITGTFVAGVTSAASATTGDVRGTYTPLVASNSAKILYIYINVEDYDTATAYGVDQA